MKKWTAGRIIAWVVLPLSVVVPLIVDGFIAGRSPEVKKTPNLETWGHEFWWTRGVAHFVALLIVIVVTAILHFAFKWYGPEGNRGLLTLVMGQDQRVSTSKLQVVLWTYAIFFALLVLLFYPNTGLVTFTQNGLQPEYLVLLGSPAAAAVLAKTFTTTKVQEGTIAKTEGPKDPGLADGLADVVSDDQGRTDLFDFQYFIFNVVALVYFFWQFIPQSYNGLPESPQTLIALTGVSAAGYATKKGLETNVPVLTGIFPPSAAPGDRVLVRGKNLTIKTDTSRNNPEDTKTSNKVRVLFGGEPEQTIQLADVPSSATDEIKVSVPTTAKPDKPAPIVVIRADNIATDAWPFDVIAGGPRITAVSPSRIVIGQGKEIEIDGVGFVEKDGDKFELNSVSLHGRKMSVKNDYWGTGQVRAEVPVTLDEAQQKGLPVPGTVELVVSDHMGRMSEPKSVELIKYPA